MGAVFLPIFLPRDDDVGAAGQGAEPGRDRVPGPAPHDDRVAQRRALEVGQVFRQVPGHGAILADDAATRLHQYTYDYLKIAGDEIANAVAGSMTRSTEDAVRRAIDDYRALEVDEIMFVPVTADIADVDRLANLIATMG